jgi:hypothetical protein
MSVIIGAGTTVVSTQFPNGGIASVNFGFQPNVQRLWQLGSFTPYDSFVQSTRTIQITVYGSNASGAGGSAPLSVAPSVSCTDADGVTITVNPASCTGSILPFAETYFATSYSYQKENIGYGQESWSFTSRPILSNYNGNIVMLRGIAEGTIATGDGVMTSSQMGVTVDETGSNDSLGAPIQGENGGVQAGTPGLGNFDIQRFIIATSVGGSMGFHTSIDGLSGNASVTIPMTPVFL